MQLKIKVGIVGSVKREITWEVESPIKDKIYTLCCGRRFDIALNRMEYEWAKACAKTYLTVDRVLEDSDKI